NTTRVEVAEVCRHDLHVESLFGLDAVGGNLLHAELLDPNAVLARAKQASPAERVSRGRGVQARRSWAVQEKGVLPVVELVVGGLALSASVLDRPGDVHPVDAKKLGKEVGADYTLLGVLDPVEEIGVVLELVPDLWPENQVGGLERRVPSHLDDALAEVTDGVRVGVVVPDGEPRATSNGGTPDAALHELGDELLLTPLEHLLGHELSRVAVEGDLA